MRVKFTKLQGAGNDYLYIDAINDLPEGLADDAGLYKNLAVKMSDRHFGVGSDGIIIILPSRKADFRMRIFNADGSEGEMCGNGMRCFAKYVHDRSLTGKNRITIETLAGIKSVQLFEESGKVKKALVEMGIPVYESSKVPVNLDVAEVLEEKTVFGGHEFKISCVSVGNPHCVIFVEDVENFNVPLYGHLIENSPLFPKRINVEFVQIISPDSVKVRTWERGSGETLACGTGACAVYSVMKKTNKIGNIETLNVILSGGVLQISGDVSKGIYMTGPAEEVFSGYYNYNDRDDRKT